MMAHFEGKSYVCNCPDGTCDMNCRMYRIAADKPSNADRIRAMTDEELAYFMANIEPCRESAWLDWLKQEVNE